MAVLVNLDSVCVAHGARQLLDGVSLGVSAGDRVGVVGRNGGGKTTLLRTLVKAEQPQAGRVTHTTGLRVGVLTQDVRVDERLTAHAAVLGDAAEHTWAGDARVREVLDGLGLHDVGLDSVVGTHVRRRAAPGGAGRAARAGVGPAGPGRADQPPRRRGRGLARRAPQGPQPRPGPPGRHARPVVPRRGQLPHVGGPRRAGRRLRGRLLRVRPGPRRARPDGGDGRAEAPAAGEEGAGLAAPRPARAHQQAAVPHRRRQRAHRRRAAGARRRRAAALRHRPARQAGVRRRDVSLAFAGRALFTTSPGGSARGTGSASSASTAPASRPCSRCS